MDAKEEMTVELRRARTWILVVGILIFVIDTILIRVVHEHDIPEMWKNRFLIIDLIILGYFFTCWIIAASKPKMACVLALVGFWGMHLALSVWANDMSLLFKNGIIMKILFTLALIRGLKSASRAEELQAQLGKVFE
jgi:hypothetical protein